MSAKSIRFHEVARYKMFAGVNMLAHAVKVTLGLIAKDGVSVAKEIELKDKLENMGAQMLKEVASRTSDVAGDGRDL